MSEIIDYYEKHASRWTEDAYSTAAQGSTIGHQRIETILKILKGYSNKTELKVLDLGCGGGHLCLALAEEGFNVTGVDQSQAMLELANERKNKAPAAVKDRIHFKESAIEDVEKIIQEKFDIITCIGVMYYLPSDSTVLNIAKKLLNKDGLLILSCRNKMFNLFNNSVKARETLAQDDAQDLMSEILMEFKKVGRKEYYAFLKNMKALFQDESFLKEMNTLETSSAIVKQANSEFVNKGQLILGRTHTPTELNNNVAEYGGIVLKLYGIQPHLLFARSEDSTINTINSQMAACLMAFQELPIALSWSSHFIATVSFDSK